MLIRRCAVLLLEPRENLRFDLQVLFRGERAFAAEVTWFALAPHLDAEVELAAADLPVLATFGETLWVERARLPADLDAARIDALLAKGLLIGDTPELAHFRERDERLRGAHWRPLSAVAHAFSRWQGQSAEFDPHVSPFRDIREMVASLGAPPPASIEIGPAAARIALPASVPGALDPALLGRYTGRNYATDRGLSLARASRLLHRTFAAQAQLELAPGTIALKKTSPSGGSLHPIEAWVLAQRIDGIAPGLYHYHPLAHALEPLCTLAADAARALALRFLAEQHWFADAAMLVIMAARVRRNFWKYRNHPKVYRALILDAGHLSQTFYLLASEAGLPAFITAAINEVDIEQALGLDPVEDAVLAVIGCGPAAETVRTVEFRGQK